MESGAPPRHDVLMTGDTRPVIRTPDQRIRVFVSSTLHELAGERRAARAAVERLRMAPVMFELGARPHPPRELYRSYLEQSDVFVGIYGASYGWVAPGEEISGLEDETMSYEEQIGRAVAADPEVEELVERIENDQRSRRGPDVDVPSGDALAMEFQRFLKDRDSD